MPCPRKRVSQVSRGTISTRTGWPSALAKALAKSFGETRAGPSSSTIRLPVQSCWMSSAAMRPISSVATMANGLSAG